MVFTRLPITPPEVNRIGWNLEHSERIICRWPRQIFGVIHAEASAKERGEFFLSCKQRTILPISGRPNFTKFAYKTWIGEVVNPFGTKFWKFPRKGLFSKKRKFFAKIFNDLRLQVAIFTLQHYRSTKTHDQMGPLRDVHFPFYRWNQLKVIALDSRLRTRNDVHRTRWWNRCNADVILRY